MAHKADLIVNKAFVIGEVSDLMYGQFFEPMGRCTHEGMYEPDHITADKNGWRQDVKELVKELGITCFRYPGGNITASYRWEDGVGPREKRPVRLDLAWSSIEDNSIGTDEYVSYVKELGAESIMCFNAGTRGIEAASDLVEYCNFPGGTKLSDMRRANGYEQPHNIRYWCIGNEVEGDWQIAQHQVDSYAWLCRQMGKAVKILNPENQVIASGTSEYFIRSFIDWDFKVLDTAFDYIDGLSIHCYTNRRKTDTTPHYLAHTARLEAYISAIEGVCKAVETKRWSKKKIYLSIDEWNVQSYEIVYLRAGREERGIKPWMVHPPLSEQIYTMEDALALGLQLIVFLKHCNRIKIACMSLLVNALSPIMTEKGGAAWRQPTFFPFAQCSKYGRGQVLDTKLECESYQDDELGAIPYVEAVMTYKSKTNELTLFAVNKRDEACALRCDLQGFENYTVQEHIVLSHSDLFAVNTVNDPENVKPHTQQGSTVKSAVLESTLEKYSWNVIRLKKA